MSPFLSVLLLAVSLLAVLVSGESLSPELKQLLCDFNGAGDNSEQIQAGSKNDLVYKRIVPVNIPAIKGPAVFFEEGINGTLYRLWVFNVTQDSRGLFRFVPHTFTDMSQYKPGEFDVSQLSSLKAEDLKPDHGCLFTVSRDGAGVFVGSFQDCAQSVNGKFPLYGVTLTCSSLRFVSPVESRETPTSEPYEITFFQKFPLPNSKTTCECGAVV